ncbi:hypothetical protein C1H46_023615 [Malus baccata]|uniref:Transducin/WD40 repeat-like superfamily protein n=1 Tax=Malus baccata TaxID=106549 RepID=A0A540LWP9_MALBA|nr:hypothetical protein C1H46_023615 [Malus baccata]
MSAVYSASLRQQLQDSGKKLVGAHHYNKEGSVTSSRCASVAWVPKGSGAFVAAHADGNFKESAGDASFPVIRDHTQFLVAHARSSKVSGVAFDSYWSPPSSDGTEENIVYRFGSVGQDTKLLLWDLPMDEIVVPLRRSSLGGSPTFSTGSQSSHWDSVYPIGTLQPAPSMRDIPKLSPLVSHCVHSEPLSGLVFTEETILTASWEGHVKIWMRPGEPENKSNAEALLGASPKDQPLTGKGYTEPSKSKPFSESKSKQHGYPARC